MSYSDDRGAKIQWTEAGAPINIRHHPNFSKEPRTGHLEHLPRTVRTWLLLGWLVEA